MTEAQAAFGRIQLLLLPKILDTFRSNANYIFKRLPDGITPPKIQNGVDHSFLILGCKFNEKVANTSRDLFVSKLTENRQTILEKESQSDIRGINFRPGKIIGPGYKTVQYHIPLYRKFAPKRKCVSGEEFVKTSIFIDIHRWRSRKEIDEELHILNKTIKEFKKMKM